MSLDAIEGNATKVNMVQGQEDSALRPETISPVATAAYSKINSARVTI